MDILEHNKVINDLRNYSIQDLSLQYFILEKKINDEKITHDAKLRKYNMIKCCVYNEIQIKQQVEEAEEIASDEDSSTSEEETETSDDDELNIKSSDIALLSETDED